ncbi:MAG: D-amino acid aminotransferase [Burkholderiaceae bacterium]
MTSVRAAPETDVRHALPESLCFLNGVYGPMSDARVSVMDRGFIFGDGVYEVIPVYSGRLFCFEQHMDRLDRSLNAVRIVNPMGRDEWKAIAQRLIDDLQSKTGKCDQLLYFQVTRGVAMRDHAMVPGLAPTVYAMTNAMKPLSATQREMGAHCVTADDFRWEKAHIKSTSLQGAVIAKQLGVDAGADETVMFRDGMLSEAATSNVWLVKNGVVSGPPKDNLVLEGVRYALVERLCQEAGTAFELRPIARHEVLEADELLLSSASKEVWAITRLDGQPVGAGKPGPIGQRLYAGYQAIKSAQCG